MKASLTNFKQSPRKVRLVADMIRGKKALVAKDMLTFIPKKSSPEIVKLLDSAIANARMQGMNAEELIVKTIFVNKANVIRRFTPKARGRAAGIRRTMSHVNIELGVVTGAKPVAKKASKKTAKKAAAKEN